MDNYTKNNNERQNELFCPVKKLKKIKVERLYSPKEIVEKIIEEYESGVDEVGTFSTHTSTTGGMVEPISGPYVPTIHDAVNGFVTKVAPADCNWLSDFLVEEDWQQGQVVLIDATCSAGKNTFVESLAQKNKFKNILILANRTANREQINDRLGTEGNYVFSHIEVKSYQALEHDYKADSNSLEKYDLIVADEAHYFVADACHNSRTNRSLELIMSTEYPVKIFMSATITELEAYILSLIRDRSKGHFLGNKLVKYVMKRSKQYIEYASCMDREQLIQQTKKSDEKWFIFVDSFQKGYKYLELLGEDAVFINSENKSGNTEAAIQLREIIEDEQFSCKYLIATACLDNGINVKDRTVKNIILDTNNKIQMIQMLGRKRCIDETDTFKLFIPYESFKEVRRLLSINLDNYDKWCNQQCALEYYHFPFLDYSMNNPEGEEQRNMLYMDEKQRKFMFNELGFYNIQITIYHLRELVGSPDIFLKKLEWLFGDIGIYPQVCNSSVDVINQKISEIMSNVSPFLEKTLQVKEKEFKQFQQVFSLAFWKGFSVDFDNHQRADRALSAVKINEACEKYNIPIRLEKKYICRQTFYQIKCLAQ